MKNYLENFRDLVFPIVQRAYRDVVPGAKWADERRFVAGNYPPPSDRPSLIFLTLHKCASVFLGSKLAELARKIGLVPLNLDQYAYMTNQKISVPLCPRGFYFGPCRSLERIAHGYPL